MDILHAAEQLRPGTKWNLRGGVLEQADDGTVRVSIPTMEEIQTCIDTDPLAYRDSRRTAYPPIGDQLDALWKGGQDAEDMHQIILAVKNQYPKP